MPALLKVRAGEESLPTGTQFTGWGEIETEDIPEYVQEIRFQHLNLRRLLQEQVNSVAGTEAEGTAQGYVIGHVAGQVEWLEKDLIHYSVMEEEMQKSQTLAKAERTREFRMAALAVPDQSQGDQGHQEGCKPPDVYGASGGSQAES